MSVLSTLLLCMLFALLAALVYILLTRTEFLKLIADCLSLNRASAEEEKKILSESFGTSDIEAKKCATSKFNGSTPTAGSNALLTTTEPTSTAHYSYQQFNDVPSPVGQQTDVTRGHSAMASPFSPTDADEESQQSSTAEYVEAFTRNANNIERTLQSTVRQQTPSPVKTTDEPRYSQKDGHIGALTMHITSQSISSASNSPQRNSDIDELAILQLPPRHHGSQESSVVSLVGLNGTGTTHELLQRSSSIVSSDDDNDTPVEGFGSASDDARRPPLRRALSSDSVTSSCSAFDGGKADWDVGQLEIRLNYDRTSQSVQLRLCQLYDVRVQGAIPLMEFWIVGFLLPHPKPLWRTKMQSGQTNPIVFQQQFSQCVHAKDVRRLALLCQLYTRSVSLPPPPSARHPTSAAASPSGKKTTDIMLVGQCRIRLKDFRIFDSPRTMWLSMLPVSEEFEEAGAAGELQFSMSYVPNAERLTVTLLKLKDLTNSDNDQGFISHTMVRAYLVIGKKVSKKKTAIKSVFDRGNVVFNETMIFNLQQAKFNKAYLRLSVIECFDETTTGESIGHVTVGSRRTGKELGHWQGTAELPSSAVTMWHRIKPKRSH